MLYLNHSFEVFVLISENVKPPDIAVGHDIGGNCNVKQITIFFTKNGKPLKKTVALN